MAVTAGLEAADDAAEVHLHLFPDEQDAMQMVWHDLQGADFYLRIISRYAPPFIMDTLPQRAKFRSWGILTVGGGVDTSNDLTEERPAAFNCHREHVGHASRIIVVHTASLH
jgi:hypothetical protein